MGIKLSKSIPHFPLPTLMSSAQQAAANLAQLTNLQQQLAQQQLHSNNMRPSGGSGGFTGYGQSLDPLEKEQENGANSIRVRDLTIPQARDILNKVLKTDIVPFLWGPPGVGKCLKGDSNILTPIGNIKIKDLKLGDKIYGINKNGLRVEGRITHLFRQISKQLLQITIDDQKIICSPEHKFLTLSGEWKEAKSLDKHGDSVVLYLDEIQPHQEVDINRGEQLVNPMARRKNMGRNFFTIKPINKIHTSEKVASENASKYFDGRNLNKSGTENGGLEKRTNDGRFGIYSGHNRRGRNNSIQHVFGSGRCICAQTQSIYNQYVNGAIQLFTINSGGLQHTRSKKIQRRILLSVSNNGFEGKKVIRQTFSLSHYQKKQGRVNEVFLSAQIKQCDWNPLHRRRNETCSTSKKREFRTGKISAINDIFTGKNGQKTYDIETTLGNYIANGFVVHNSTLVREICKEQKWQLIDLRLSLLNPVDLRGLPVVDKDNRTADWYPPTFLPKYTDKSRGVLFLDEINLAPISVQAAAYQLILDKRVGEYRFPPTWKIVAAGNRETDRANVYKISAPLANRFIHFTVTADLKTWKEWATGRVRQEIIDFLLLRPALLLVMPTDSEKAFPSPRTWEFTSNLLNIYDYDDSEGVSDELKKVIIATIGLGTGRELIAFLESYKIKEVGELVKNFLTTGKITMPKAYSMRYAIIKAVYKAYLDGDVDEVTFRKNFVAKISAEEQNTIQSYESANADKLKARKQKSSVQVTLNKIGTLLKPVGATESIFTVSANLEDSGMLLLKDSSSTEVVQYKTINSMEIQVWRGLSGTVPQRWPAGTNLYRL